MTIREIPFSLDAEESLLGNILLFPQSLRECLQEDLQSEDFYLEKNQKIYTVMLNMNERNENIDTISLGSKLKDFGLFDKIGGMEYLMNLAGKTVGASNTKEYIRIIKSKSISRQIIKAGEEISRGAADSTVPIDDIINLAKDKAGHLVAGLTLRSFHQDLLVVGQSLFEDGAVTDGYQLVEVVVCTNQVGLADVVADIGFVTRDGATLILRQYLIEEVVDLTNAGKVPGIAR